MGRFVLRPPRVDRRIKRCVSDVRDTLLTIRLPAARSAKNQTAKLTT